MNKKILLLAFISLSLFIPATYGQSVEALIQKIDNKLLLDTTYLNIYIVELGNDFFEGNYFSEIPRADYRPPISLAADDPELSIKYRFGVLDDPEKGEPVDSMVLLFIEKITRLTIQGESDLGRVGGADDNIDRQRIFTFKDFYQLQESNPGMYDSLRSIIKFNMYRLTARQLVGLNIDRNAEPKTGFSSVDNSDFLNFVKINGMHDFSLLDKTSGSTATGWGRSGESSSSKTPFKLDASFSHIAFSMEEMKFGPGGASLEVGFSDKVLNLLPYQSNYLQTGIRFLFNFDEGLRSRSDQFVLDARLLGRVALNTKDIIESLPFVQVDGQLLNVTSGASVDINTTRLMGLPFLNFYYSSGSSDFNEPGITLGTEDSSWAYFSTTQWEGSMSFYWNTNYKRTMKLRLDLGVGSYDIHRVTYQTGTIQSEDLIFDQMYPLVALYFNLSMEDEDILGVHGKFFDSRLKSGVWLKLLQFDEHEFRVVADFVTSPFWRSLHEWESEGGSIFQIRYRYGL